MNTVQPDSRSIREMFDSLAGRYDLFNRLTSMGLDGRWRARALEGVRPGMRVLDVGCGTGDLCLGAAARLAGDGLVTGLDFSPRMLEIARSRLGRAGLNGAASVIRFVQKSAEDLPLSGEAPYDLVVSGFVLRNLYQNIDRILEGMRLSLRPGGRVSLLDLTQPAHPVLAAAWRAYLATAVRGYGRILFGAAYPPDYLPESAERFPSREAFAAKLRAAGFEEVRTRGFLAGAITLYEARRP